MEKTSYDALSVSELNDLIEAKARRLMKFRFDSLNSSAHERMIALADELAMVTRVAAGKITPWP